MWTEPGKARNVDLHFRRPALADCHSRHWAERSSRSAFALQRKAIWGRSLAGRNGSRHPLGGQSGLVALDESVMGRWLNTDPTCVSESPARGSPKTQQLQPEQQARR